MPVVHSGGVHTHVFGLCEHRAVHAHPYVGCTSMRVVVVLCVVVHPQAFVSFGIFGRDARASPD